MQHTTQAAAHRLAALRSSLRSAGLQGFIAPKADAFQNGMLPAHWDRLAWLTGFTGSAGCAVVLEDKAALIVDSRYTLQAKAQTDASLTASNSYRKRRLEPTSRPTPRRARVLGYDPALHTLAGFKALKEERRKLASNCARSRRTIDALWEDRPSATYAPIIGAWRGIRGRKRGLEARALAEGYRG